MKKNYAIILIGGNGSRFSDERPKQFFELNNKPLIYYSIYNFLQNKNIDKIITVMNKNHEKFLFEKIIKKYFHSEFLNEKLVLCLGGERRIQSTENAIFFIKNTFNNCKNVLIHDGCRPFFSQNLIDNLVNKMNTEKYDCLLPVLKISESIKYIKDEKIESKNRNFFYTAQTPQICSFEKLLECFEKNNIENDDHFLNDESGFLETNGYKVSFIEGEKQNIKITFPEDLKLAEFFLKM